MNYTETIPIKSYTKKFLTKFLCTEPYTVSKNDVFGNFLIHELKGSIYNFDDRTKNEPEFEDALQIIIPESYSNKYKIKGISLENIKAINNYLDRLFDSYFKSEMAKEIKKNKQSKIKDLIFEFRNFYQLTEDDISYETLKKKFYRFSKERFVKIS